MRDFLDDILAFIDAESLTDEEFSALSLEGSPEPSKEAYTALHAVLETRESVSDATKRLRYYFLAAGTDVGDAEAPATTPKSNILIGTKL